jgi:hypothetical protein
VARYSDYDDDEYYRKRPRSSNSSLILILGIGAAVLCLCLVVCGGLFYLGMQAFKDGMANAQSAMAQAQLDMQEHGACDAAADTFMRDVAAGRLKEAYAATTKNFQTRQPLAQFRTFVGQNPALKNYQPDSLEDTDFTPTMAAYEGSVTAKNGKEVTFTLQLAKDGTTWKIDGFTIP